jgi:ADP-ribosylglycohydrolase
MSLTADQRDVLTDLSSEQIAGLTEIFGQVIEQFETWVLGCSLGEFTDSSAQQKLVAVKYRHEGALKAKTLFLTELQRIKRECQERLEASDSVPKKGKK